MLSRLEKKAQIKKLSDYFSRSKASFLVNCIGLNVDQMTELRKSLKKSQADIKVIRNTLSLRVLSEYPEIKKTYESSIKGPNAFVVAFQDPVQVAKILDDFSRDHEVFQVKKGVLEGSALSSEEVKTLAKLPPIDVLKAQFLSVLESPLKKFLGLLEQVPRSFVYALSEKKNKTEKPS